MSPRLNFVGSAWNSVGAASETDSFKIENLPATVAGTTTAKLVISSSIAGGAFSDAFYIFSSGAIQSNGAITSNGNFVSPATFGYTWAAQSIVSSPANAQVNITNAAVSSGVGFDVSTDNTLKIRNRAQNADGALTVGAGTFSSTLTVNASTTFGAANLAFWNGRAVMSSPADGQWNLTISAQSAGVGLDASTDSLLKIRTRAQSGDAGLSCSTIAASGQVSAPLTSGQQSPGSQTIVTGTYGLLVGGIKFTSTQRLTAQGTARVRIV